jgi:hypothetical protein
LYGSPKKTYFTKWTLHPKSDIFEIANTNHDLSYMLIVIFALDDTRKKTYIKFQNNLVNEQLIQSRMNSARSPTTIYVFGSSCGAVKFTPGNGNAGSNYRSLVVSVY